MLKGGRCNGGKGGIEPSEGDGECGLGVLACCDDFEYGGNAEISLSMIHNEIVNPANKKDCLMSLNSSMNLSQKFPIIFLFVHI